MLYGSHWEGLIGNKIVDSIPPTLLALANTFSSPIAICVLTCNSLRLTKLEVGIAGADVVEGAHEAFKDKSNTHGIVDTKELWNSVSL